MGIKDLIDLIQFLQGYPSWVKTTFFISGVVLVILLVINGGLLLFTPKVPNGDPVQALSEDESVCTIDHVFGEDGYREIRTRDAAITGHAIVVTSDRLAILSSEIDDQNTRRIRVDLLKKQGSPDKNFGLGGVGFIRFDLPMPYRAKPERITSLSDNSLLITGTAFNDQGHTASPFLTKVRKDGSLDPNFGNAGTLLLSADGPSYGWDTVEADDHLYTISSRYGSNTLTIFTINLENTKHPIQKRLVLPTQANQMAWPNRIIKAFPEKNFYVMGKMNGGSSSNTQGFIAKLDSRADLVNHFGTSGIFLVRDKLNPPYLHNMTGIALSADGGLIASGYGNEGFAIALDKNGNLKSTFGKSGSYTLRGIYRTDSTSVLVLPSRGLVSIGGMESDGNSNMNGFIAFTDLEGREVKCTDDNMLRLSATGKSQVIDLASGGDHSIYGLVQHGIMSERSKWVSIVKTTP